MRKYFVLLLAVAFSAAAADITGTWKGTFTREDHDPGPALVIVKQTGDSVTGTGGPNETEQHEIVNGKVAGDKFTFEIHQEQGSMKFVMTLDGDSMSGQATRERDGQQQTAKLELKREAK